MATVLPDLPNQWFDDNGQVLAGGLIYTYDAGTSNPRTTWFDAAETVPNANPVVLNASGEATIFWRGSYRIEVRTSAGVLVRTIDNVTDAVSSITTSLSASSGSSLIGFIQSGVGAVARTQQAKDRELISVTDFGADPTGTIDSTSAINAALIAAFFKKLYFPAGTYLTSGLHNVPGPLFLCGDGIGKSIIRATNAANDIFTFAGGDNEVEALTFNSSVVRTGTATYLRFQPAAARISVEGCSFLGWARAIWSEASGVQISRCIFTDGVPATGIAMFVRSATAASVDQIIVDGSPASKPLYGLQIQSAGDFQITNSSLSQCLIPTILSPGNGDGIGSFGAVMVFFDEGTQDCFRIAPTGTGAVQHTRLQSCWMSGCDAGNGFRALGGGATVINGLSITDCHVLQNAGEGILLDTVSNAKVVNNFVGGNTGNGISVSGTCTNVQLSGNTSGQTNGVAGNAGSGINFFTTTHTGTMIVDNTLTGNTVTSINNAPTTSIIIARNIGFGFGSAVYDPPNLADGAGVTTTVPVTGSGLGDAAYATFSLDLQGITVTAWVSAAGTVSVRFQNETGGAIDLASGTLRVWIERRT